MAVLLDRSLSKGVYTRYKHDTSRLRLSFLLCCVVGQIVLLPLVSAERDESRNFSATVKFEDEYRMTLFALFRGIYKRFWAGAASISSLMVDEVDACESEVAVNWDGRNMPDCTKKPSSDSIILRYIIRDEAHDERKSKGTRLKSEVQSPIMRRSLLR